ncbi:MAG: ATP-dependent DNA helicase [Candidatus Omnitrophica bacterium]|nr:ATP-dependent DNA helicase [Candidatus Omnitrophota bacterium]
MQTMLCEEILSPGGLIAEKHPGYEFRPHQIEMAKAVERAISARQHLIAEAGTGIGKSLAYLAPFIIWSKKEYKKVAISTYTKTLQEQLVNKDLPFLQDSMDIDFTFALCVGSENYLCRRRLVRLMEQGLLDIFEKTEEVEKIIAWEKETDTGLRMGMDSSVSDRTWSHVCRQSDLCRGNRCHWRKDCFYAKARKAQAKADILVLNHHLFFANLASGGKVLPDYDAAVFDEAHTLEDVATNHLGVQISNAQVNFLLNIIYNARTRKGLVTRIPELAIEKEKFIELIRNARGKSDSFFRLMLDKLGSEEGRKRVRSPLSFDNVLEGPLRSLSGELLSMRDRIEDEDDKKDLEAYAGRCKAIAQGIKAFMEQVMEEHVYWVETAARPHYILCSLRISPINVAKAMKEEIFDITRPSVLTSATLTTDGTFRFIKERVGLTDAQELLAGSSFDYKKQALLYVADRLPDPSYHMQEYQKTAASKVEEILNITRGRTFVLFTSYQMLELVRSRIDIEGVEILCQGQLPQWKLLQRFKQRPSSVLFATYSFWQGVDVPGEALRCVIITKLPFAVPDEPVIEARLEHLVSKGVEPFRHYQLPQAVIMLRQGFGRLIRTRSDTGVVAILDPRMRTRSYGRAFFNSLPECTRATRIDEMRGWLIK